MIYYLTYSDDGSVTGGGQTTQHDSLSSGNFIECTEEQHNDLNSYRVLLPEKTLIKKDLQDLIKILKVNKKAEIKKLAELSYNNPVTDPSNRVWNGGVNSANSISLDISSAKITGLKTVGLYDINNEEHILNIDDALYVPAYIMAEYKKLLARKQYIYSVIDSYSDTDPKTIQLLDEVVW